jgi:oxalate decarboxylase/phosphoglucose isomerase-like protein (cupin superfamily)
VEEIRLVILKKGEAFTVTKEYGHLLLNLGDDPVVTVDDHDPKESKNDYQLVKKKKGFAYYILEREGKPKALPNPNYSKLPPLKIDEH